MFSKVQPGTAAERGVIVAAGIGCAVLLLIDQLTKLLVAHDFQLYESRPLIDGFFALTFVTNKGAAWGILAGKGWLLLLIAATVLVLALLFLRRLTEGYPERYWAIFCVISGILGNSIDRIWRGQVIDFLDFQIRGYHWPAFNVADCAICIGVGIFLLSSIFRPDTGNIPAPPEEEEC